jgi:ornithine cyclodeaminase
VTAFGVLAQVDNGYPVFLAEMTLLTALRTAATSALAARALARPDSRILALIGAGSQAEFQALAFRGVLGIEELRVFDIDAAAIEKVRRNLEPLGFRIHAATSIDDAVAGADVITTCTADKARNTILDLAQVRPGVHVNAIGGDCPGKTELDPRILEGARVVVEFTPQTRVEGEIQQMAPDFPVTELWEVLTGAAPGRRDAQEITVFDSVGFAISDFSALRCARDATAGTALEAEVDLVARPDDPKDLFSLVDVLAPVG